MLVVVAGNTVAGINGATLSDSAIGSSIDPSSSGDSAPPPPWTLANGTRRTWRAAPHVTRRDG